MFVIFVTTLPMTMLKPNAFLFGVAFVSFYLALTSWLRARYRAAAPVLTDWLLASGMFLGALIISLWAFPLARAGDAKGTGLLAFAAVGAALAIHGDVTISMTRRSGSGNGTGFNKTAFTTVKIAVPMPSVSAATAARVKPGLRLNVRSE